jgi:hypothetical protein
MTKVLRFWIECAIPDSRTQDPGHPRTGLIAKILREYEACGDAMRYVDARGRVAWKATPRMLSRLADAERDARDDVADVP